MPLQTLLKQRFHYDPTTGIFTWKDVPNLKRELVNSIAGGLDGAGYRLIRFNNTRYKASHLAWLYMTGVFPKDFEVDHKNRLRDDDRWCNLRKADRSQNCCNRGLQSNNTTGVKGLTYRPNSNCYGKPRYIAQVRLKGKNYSKSVSVSSSKTEDMVILELTEWMYQKRLELHGDFAND